MRIGWLVLGLMGCKGKESEETDDTDAGPTDTDTLTGTYAASCAGDVAGTYTGDIDGPIDGELQENGVMNFRFDSKKIGGTVSASGLVQEDGTIEGEESGLSISGFFDLVTCQGTGTWSDSNFNISGTWEMATVQ